MTPKTLITVQTGVMHYVKQMIDEPIGAVALAPIFASDTAKNLKPNAKGKKQIIRVWQLVAEVEKGEI